jgi:L-lactate dehydrogenase complex protein LldE
VKVGLFVPCYVDQLYPDVALATVELLERFDVDVEFPRAQTCCGQPFSNFGLAREARPLAERYADVFAGYAYVVCPSGSCVAMVRHHHADLIGNEGALGGAAARTFELCEFLWDVLGLRSIPGRFPYRVGLHASCHGLRELQLGPASERVFAGQGGVNGGAAPVDKVRQLLGSLEGLAFAELDRPDECCGFGGSFAVSESAVSVEMGLGRLADHERGGAQVLTSVDSSCLAQLASLMKPRGQAIPVMHVAEILAGRGLAGVPAR